MPYIPSQTQIHEREPHSVLTSEEIATSNSQSQGDRDREVDAASASIQRFLAKNPPRTETPARGIILRRKNTTSWSDAEFEQEQAGLEIFP